MELTDGHIALDQVDDGEDLRPGDNPADPLHPNNLGKDVIEEDADFRGEKINQSVASNPDQAEAPKVQNTSTLDGRKRINPDSIAGGWQTDFDQKRQRDEQKKKDNEAAGERIKERRLKLEMSERVRSNIDPEQSPTAVETNVAATSSAETSSDMPGVVAAEESVAPPEPEKITPSVNESEKTDTAAAPNSSAASEAQSVVSEQLPSLNNLQRKEAEAQTAETINNLKQIAKDMDEKFRGILRIHENSTASTETMLLHAAGVDNAARYKQVFSEFFSAMENATSADQVDQIVTKFVLWIDNEAETFQPKVYKFMERYFAPWPIPDGVLNQFKAFNDIKKDAESLRAQLATLRAP